MRVNTQIESLLSKLVAIQLTRGVQPSEVADAVFEDNYVGIEFAKKSNRILMTVKYFDDDDEAGPVPHEMRYVYGVDRYLLRIEQRVDGGSFRVQWDRAKSIDYLLKEIVRQLEKINNRKRVNGFLAGLPEELRSNLKEKLRLVA